MKEATRGRKEKENIYVPVRGRIEKIERKTEDVTLFMVRTKSDLDYKPGQFFMISVWGAGEIPISVASLCEGDGSVELCVRKTGVVTAAIHSLRKDDSLWLRGPYGNSFPMEGTTKSDVLIVAGGIGIAPLRPLVRQLMEDRGERRNVTLLYGSRTPGDVVFADEADRWREKGIKVVLTVDRSDDGWKGHIGLVTELWHEVGFDLAGAVAYICGPEIMIRSSMRDLSRLGMSDERIITTLEAHMKCGVGKCGHCYSGAKYICTDGPVFSYKETKELSLLR